MVETRRSSSSSKRPLPSPSSSPLPNGKRSKAAKASFSTNETPPPETLGRRRIPVGNQESRRLWVGQCGLLSISFLKGSWAKDENTLKFGLQRLRDFPHAIWLALFVEGTRFTQAKLLAAQEYASSMACS